MKRIRHLRLASVAALIALGSVARATGVEPGSLLIFPLVDNTPGKTTLITVTNAHPTAGVDVEFRYVNSTNCLKLDTTHHLTANDTFSVITRFEAGSVQLGYCYAFAKINGQPVSWNCLLGSEVVWHADTVCDFEVQAITYKAVNRIGGNPTNVDGDGLLDLDGREYEKSASLLLFPRFFGQGAVVQSELVLINLTGGARFTAIADFAIYNDNEVAFSAQYEFTCWAKVPLSTISGAFNNDFLLFSGQNPQEVAGLGGLETGWFTVDGGTAFSTAAQFDDPALLALKIEKMAGVGLTAAILPFVAGRQDNGDLLPLGVFGDTSP
jgi:hypothetical protein